MQRNGRKDNAYFRVIVQEARLSPKSGRVVAYIGTYDPHTKEVNIDVEKAGFYMENGAQPSDSVARLFRSQKIKLPEWVKIEDTQSRNVKNSEKLRKHQPAEEEAPEEAAPAEETSEEAVAEVEEASTEAEDDAKSDEEKA